MNRTTDPKKLMTGEEWYRAFFNALSDIGIGEINLTLTLNGHDVLKTEEVLSAARRVSGVES